MREYQPVTAEQRKRAIAQLPVANDIRIERAKVREQIRTGKLKVAEVIGDPPDCMRTAKVSYALKSVEGIGDGMMTEIWTVPAPLDWSAPVTS